MSANNQDQKESDPDFQGPGSQSNVEMNLNPWFYSIAASIALIVLGGFAEGYFSNRWGVSPNILEIGKRLNNVPMEIGSWVCTEESELPKQTQEILDTKGYISRTYTHQTTGENVVVAVLFGPKGPIAVHTPEVCYSSKAFTQLNQRESVPIDSDEDPGNLWKLNFVDNSFEKRKLCVHYGWTDGGPWQAAIYPRFWRTDYLYKIQTACTSLGKKEDSSDEFFRVFLPELRKQIWAR